MNRPPGLELLSVFRPLAVQAAAVHLYWVNRDDLRDDFWELLVPLLSPQDWVEINRLSRPEAQKNLILSRGLLRVLLSEWLGRAPGAIRLVANPWGKLLIADYSLQFNVTHSRSLLVFACSDRFTVGVDVEYVRPLHALARLVQRYATPGEQDDYRRLPLAAQPRYFLELWTAKEAYSKALGTGLTGMLGQFSRLDTRNPREIALPGGWPAHIQRFDLHNNYIGAVCWGVTPGADALKLGQTQSVDRFPR
ncbi:MAG: 4'-phosphopantetheinyl transferase superfamily protein [Gloeomargarita sp. DG02_5_bins_242]